MNKKQKLAETRRRIVALESRLKTMRENRGPRTGLAYLIESELEKAEIVLAAKGIIDKIGKMAEDLAKVNGDDIMPMMDSLKAAFGPDMAGNFQGIAQEKLNAATIALTQIKDAISSEVSKLEGVVNGGATNDMGTGTGAPDINAAPIGNVGGAAPPPDGGAPVPQGDEGLGADMSTDQPEAAGDEQLDGAFAQDGANGPSAGRAKKEGARPRGRMVKEGEFVPGKKGVNPFAKTDDKKSDKKSDKTDDKKSDKDSEKEKLDEAKKHKKKGHYVCSKVRGGYGVVSGPYGGCSAASSKKGDGQCVLSHDGEGNWCHAEGGKSGSAATVVDSAPAASGDAGGASAVSEGARALAASNNPDALIFNSFRKQVREGRSPITAARAVASVFAVDFDDVVDIVRESRAGK